jgi:hypothetical protein
VGASVGAGVGAEVGAGVGFGSGPLRSDELSPPHADSASSAENATGSIIFASDLLANIVAPVLGL